MRQVHSQVSPLVFQLNSHESPICLQGSQSCRYIGTPTLFTFKLHIQENPFVLQVQISCKPSLPSRYTVKQTHLSYSYIVMQAPFRFKIHSQATPIVLQVHSHAIPLGLKGTQSSKPPCLAVTQSGNPPLCKLSYTVKQTPLPCWYSVIQFGKSFLPSRYIVIQTLLPSSYT